MPISSIGDRAIKGLKLHFRLEGIAKSNRSFDAIIVGVIQVAG
jgi:hypothetical protein